MNILFATFGQVSINRGDARAVSILRALVDAGHKVDIIAAKAEIPEHTSIKILEGAGDMPVSRRRLRVSIARATSAKAYDVVHALDDSVIFMSRICRIRKIRLVYDAVRILSREAPFRLWKLFPNYFRKLERRALEQAEVVLGACPVLCADLKKTAPSANVMQVEDVPAQSLFSGQPVEKATLLETLNRPVSKLIVCSVLPDSQVELRKVLLAARKVIDVIPDAAFFFKGIRVSEAESMAVNLDIRARCVFLTPDQAADFMAVLELADAVLMVPSDSCRYLSPEVMTLLQAHAPLVAVLSESCSRMLSEETCVQVVPSAEAIAEGLLRVVQEPLFSVKIAVQGQQLIADSYSLSSFKHKIRMVYHEVLNQE